jgi:5-methylcytosine-specific restriction protein A
MRYVLSKHTCARGGENETVPQRIQTPCSYVGCPNLSGSRYCTQHVRVAAKDDARFRGTAASRGYDARHRRWRTMVLARHPVCTMCRLQSASVADHIVPLNPRDPRGGDWSLENGQGLCHACHNRKTATDLVAKGAVK